MNMTIIITAFLTLMSVFTPNNGQTTEEGKQDLTPTVIATPSVSATQSPISLIKEVEKPTPTKPVSPPKEDAIKSQLCTVFTDPAQCRLAYTKAYKLSKANPDFNKNKNVGLFAMRCEVNPTRDVLKELGYECKDMFNVVNAAKVFKAIVDKAPVFWDKADLV